MTRKTCISIDYNNGLNGNLGFLGKWRVSGFREIPSFFPSLFPNLQGKKVKGIPLPNLARVKGIRTDRENLISLTCPKILNFPFGATFNTC